MGVTLRSFILAALLIVAAAFLYRWSSSGFSAPDEAQVLQKYPSFQATGFNGDNFAADGRLLHHIEAREAVYYKLKDLLTMQQPSGVYYYYPQNENVQSWHLQADEGYIIFDQEAVLTGHIEARPLFKSEYISEARTDFLRFDLMSNLIESPAPVIVRGPDFLNYGTGLKVDLTARTVWLGAAHAQYTFP